MKELNSIKDEELRNILIKIEKKMIEVFHSNLVDVILYGSYARNENQSDSDMDIMVIVNEKEEDISKYDDTITDIMVDMSLENNIVLSVYAQSVEQYKKQNKVLPFLMNIQKEGIKIHG